MNTLHYITIVIMIMSPLSVQSSMNDRHYNDISENNIDINGINEWSISEMLESKILKLNMKMEMKEKVVYNPNWELFEIALGEYDELEIKGSKDNPRIVEYAHSTGHTWVKDDETAWCSAFMNWVAKTGNYEHTNKLNARSWLDIGEVIEIEAVKIGDVCILWRTSPSHWHGHTAFYVKHNDSHVWLLGGDQSNKVTVSKYPLNQVLGFRRLSKNDLQM